MAICSLSVSEAAIVPLKLPSGLTSAGADEPRVKFTIVTVSCTPAEPCVAVIVDIPLALGIDAEMLPAAGIGGGAVSRLVNCAVTAAGRWRPTKSATPVP